jgi:ABC-type transport system involved in multi-copper enzyme maturation permease subunit
MLGVTAAQSALPLDPATGSVQRAAGGAYRAVLLSPEATAKAGFTRFSDVIIFTLFTTFLLPLWSLSFATEALGREREDRNLLWLLTRPLSRPAIYLAKYVAVLPWALGLNLGGFAVLCLAAGEPGRMALRLYWPAVFWGTLAFAALFHLMGAWFRRAAVVAILYSFFLETILGNLPAYWKRASISFYTRCLMYDRAQDLGIQPEKPLLYLPVGGTAAWGVLLGLTVALLALGMFVFSRREYLDLS